LLDSVLGMFPFAFDQEIGDHSSSFANCGFSCQHR
jgi:hypothetical protein